MVYFFFIETRGATLEEISRTFDGVEAVEELKELALEKAKIDNVEDISKGSVSGVEHVHEVEGAHQRHKA